jgi:hypothetical protein
MNDKIMRRLALAFAAAVMVMMMAAPSFAETITANVHFITYNTSNTTIYDKWDQAYSITAKNVTVPVTYDTDNFSTVIPGATSSNHQYYGTDTTPATPTVMDAIYTAYLTTNGSSTGWASYWDTSSNPKGAYIYTAFGNPQVTTVLDYHNWAGYTWLLYLNTTSLSSSWNSTTRTGMLPYYGSNVVLEDEDDIYVRYLYATESY